MYNIYLNSVSNIYLPILIPIGIGLILGGIIFMKLTKFLLNKFYIQTFSAIIGFTLGSILILVPNVNNIKELIISILLVGVGALAWKLN